jgi:hypothetical protein
MTTMTTPGRPRTAPKRRRSTVIRRLVITLVVLAGLLVAADFGAAAVAEHEVSKRARVQFGLADDPEVTVRGFSFLLQALSGEYENVDITATGVPVNTLRDVQVEAHLHGVHAPLGDLLSGNTKEILVRDADGTVKVKAADVTRAISQNENEALKTITRVTIDPATNAQVADPNAKPDGQTSQTQQDKTRAGARLCATADVIGTSTDLCVFGIIALVNQKITFAPARLEIRNGLTTASLPAAVQKQVLAPFAAISLDPGVLPFKVTPTEVTVNDDHSLSVSGTAKNVRLGGTG